MTVTVACNKYVCKRRKSASTTNLYHL